MGTEAAIFNDSSMGVPMSAYSANSDVYNAAYDATYTPDGLSPIPFEGGTDISTSPAWGIGVSGLQGLFSGFAGFGTKMAAGKAAQDAANIRAAYIEEEGEYGFQSYIAEAARTREQADKYQAAQTMKYALTGVSLQGTPMLAMDYTARQSHLEVEALETRAARTKRLALLNAAATREEGKYAKLNAYDSAFTGLFGNLGKLGGLDGMSLDFGGKTKTKTYEADPLPMSNGGQSGSDYKMYFN